MTPTAPKSTTIGFVGDPGTEAELQRGVSTLNAAGEDSRVRLQSLSSLSWEQAAAELDALLVIPETSTWSRSRHRRHTGPQPLRNMDNPWGLPWLQDKDQETVNSANRMIRRQFALMSEWVKQKPSCPLLLVHREDLGMAEGGIPASLWQLLELRLWANEWGLKRYGTFQCYFGPGDWPFPIGLLSSHPLPHKIFHPGWPKFQNASRRYVGPIPRFCKCPKGQHLADKDFYHRHLRTRSSSLLLKGFAQYLITYWASQSMHTCSGAKLWQRGSDSRESLVRAVEGSDSDATDAEQADVDSDAFGSMGPEADQEMGRSSLDMRAMAALGIGARNHRYAATRRNGDGRDHLGDESGSEGTQLAQDIEKSEGQPYSYSIQDSPGMNDVNQERQVQQKTKHEKGARK